MQLESIAATVLLACGLVAQDQKVTIAGRVVDAEGKPVSGVEVSGNWTRQNGEYRAYESAETDADGRFELATSMWNDSFPLVAFDADRERAAVAVYDKKEEPLQLVLRPTVRLTGKLTCSELGKAPTWANFQVNIEGGTPLSIFVDGGALDAHVPRGDWSYEVYDEYFTTRRGKLEIPEHCDHHDLGSIDFKAHFIAKHIGKAVPEWANVSAARNRDSGGTAIASFRGKWLLIEFWGYW